jgi:hypothetical protein
MTMAELIVFTGASKSTSSREPTSRAVLLSLLALEIWPPGRTTSS